MLETVLTCKKAEKRLKLLLGSTLVFIITLNCLQMKAFFERSEAGTSENARKQALERTQANIDWLKKYEETITKWLGATVGA